MISYCESLRLECRASGVRVVTIVPGYVDTPLTRSSVAQLGRTGADTSHLERALASAATPADAARQLLACLPAPELELELSPPA